MSIIDLFYPKTCGMCEQISNSYICPKCKYKIKGLLKVNTIKYSNKYFNTHTYLFKYEGVIREKLLNYKFNDFSYLYKFFSEIAINNCNLKNKYDIILPVPIHKNRKNVRGYNQSDLISREISKKLNIEYNNKILKKKFNNKPQSTLTEAQRKNNVLGMYKLENAQMIENKKILLIDDIYTTGSTVNECAKVLKNGGAEFIDILTIAKD